MSEQGLYDPLVTREFKSTIPAHLLGKLSDGERHMVETLSRLENQYEWMLTALLQQNKMVLDLAHRQSKTEEWRAEISPKLELGARSTDEIVSQVKSLWDWKNVVSGKTGVLFWIATMLVPLILKVVIDWLLKAKS